MYVAADQSSFSTLDANLVGTRIVPTEVFVNMAPVTRSIFESGRKFTFRAA